MHRRDFLQRTAAGLVAGATGGRAATSSALSPSRKKVRVAMFGAAHSHAAGKLAAIRDLSDDFALIGVVEPDAKLRQALQSHPKYQGVTWMSEADLLDSGQIDAVVVETAVHDLVPTAQGCIDAGLHLHLEKPGCESRAEFTRLFDVAGHRKLHIQMGYMLRHNPAFEFCFRAVREGWLGRIFEVTGSMSKLVGDDDRKEFAEYAGGSMFELGCHLIDSLLTILGPPTKVTPISRKTRDDLVIDNQTAVFEYRDTIATIRASIVEPDGNERRHFEVSGENGTLAIRPLEPPKLELVLQRPVGGFKSGRQRIDLPRAKGRYHDHLKTFARIVRVDEQPRWSPKHDLAVHRTVLQASGLPTDS